MKKIGLLGLMLIVAHNFANAQTSYNFNAGTGIWIVNSNPKSFDGQTICDPWFAPTLFIGASASKTFESNFVASIGADFHLLFSNSAYKMFFDNKWDGDKTTTYYWWDDSSESALGDAENAAKCFVIALPISIGYQIGKFTPNVGFEYGIRYNNNDAEIKKNTLSATAGLKYQLSPKIAITLNYASNLVPDMTHKVRKVKETCIETEDGSERKLETQAEKKVNWHSQRVELGVSYRFGKPTNNSETTDKN